MAVVTVFQPCAAEGFALEVGLRRFSTNSTQSDLPRYLAQLTALVWHAADYATLIRPTELLGKQIWL